MRNYLVALVAAAAALSPAVMADRAEAVTLGNPAGMRAAIEDVAVTESVHCVPGWVHGHRWGWGTGCGFVGGPVVAVAPRYAVVAPAPLVVVAPRRAVRYRRW